MSTSFVVAVGCSSGSEGVVTSDAGAGSDASSTGDSSTSAEASTSSDASTTLPDTGPSPDSSAPAACNALGVPAYAPQEAIASAAPAATGGTIADGTWDLVNIISFTGPGGASGPMGTSTMAERYEVSGATWQLGTSVNGNAAHFTQHVVMSGTSLTPTTTCGSGVDGTLPYSATSSTLTIYTFGGHLGLVFNKK